MSLLDRLVKNSTIKLTAALPNSKVYGKKDFAPTPVPMVNVALSGRVDGGMVPGLLILAGPSKHFKSAFALLMAGAYMKKHPDAVMLFYDSEFGTPQAYFESFGIDMNRVVHTPIVDVEELKIDISNQLSNIVKGDKVIIVLDSMGNLASRKEVDDALEGKTVADMSRAKQFKSLYRIITPHLNLKDIPMIVVNHTYKTLEMYSKDVVSGGTGVYYSADAIWIIGRQQEKDGKDVTGYNFVINIEKSRHVREKSKIPITVTFEGGISKTSGLLDVAYELGVVTKPKLGWYEIVNPETGEVLSEKSMRAKEFESMSVWQMIFEKTDLGKRIENAYTMGGKPIMSDDVEVDIDDDLDYDEE